MDELDELDLEGLEDHTKTLELDCWYELGRRDLTADELRGFIRREEDGEYTPFEGWELEDFRNFVRRKLSREKPCKHLSEAMLDRSLVEIKFALIREYGAGNERLPGYQFLTSFSIDEIRELARVFRLPCLFRLGAIADESALVRLVSSELLNHVLDPFTVEELLEEAEASNMRCRWEFRRRVPSKERIQEILAAEVQGNYYGFLHIEDFRPEELPRVVEENYPSIAWDELPLPQGSAAVIRAIRKTDFLSRWGYLPMRSARTLPKRKVPRNATMDEIIDRLVEEATEDALRDREPFQRLLARSNLETIQGNGRWLLVASKEAATEIDHLDPEQSDNLNDWWTCHKDTQPGDVMVLYQASPRCQVTHVFVATSSAYPTSDLSLTATSGWDYACEVYVYEKLRSPLPLAAMKADPAFRTAGAVRRNFQRAFFELTEDEWAPLSKLIEAENPGFEARIEQLRSSGGVPAEVLSERQVHRALADNLDVLTKFGLDLVPFEDPHVSGRSHVEYRIQVGRIDLMCQDRATGNPVVVELKIVPAGRSEYAQISTYINWVQRHHCRDTPPLGVMVCAGVDKSWDFATMNSTARVQLLELQDVVAELKARGAL